MLAIMFRLMLLCGLLYTSLTNLISSARLRLAHSFKRKNHFNSFCDTFEFHFTEIVRADYKIKIIYSKEINFSRNQANEISLEDLSFFLFFFFNLV